MGKYVVQATSLPRRQNRKKRTRDKSEENAARAEVRRRVETRQAGRCKVCRVALGSRLDRVSGGLVSGGELHEIVPRWVSKATLTDIDNVILVCPKCHDRIERGEIPELKQSLPWQRYLPLDKSDKSD